MAYISYFVLTLNIYVLQGGLKICTARLEMFLRAYSVTLEQFWVANNSDITEQALTDSLQ